MKKSMGMGENTRLETINKTLELLLEEIKNMNKTMKEISKKLDKISNDTYRIP